MKYSEQVRLDAKAAADYIREHGWRQNQLGDRLGPCCAMGASLYSGAANDGQDLDDAFMEECGTCPAVYNDTPGRTKEEVLAVFERIANS